MTYRALMVVSAVLFAVPAVAQNTWDGNGDLNVNINGRNNALTPTVNTAPSPGSLQNVNLTQIGGIAYAPGSAASAASAPVVIASDQAAIAIKGAASNAGSGVATSSLNAPSIAYNYGFNGTTWDQLQVDGSKNLKVNIAAGTVTDAPLVLTPVTASTALESNHVLKGSAGTFYGVQVNTTTSAEWVMLFNLTALPSNGAVTPIAFWQVPANTTLSISENPAFTMSTGITIGCSTTGPFTLTASALCTFAGGQVQ